MYRAVVLTTLVVFLLAVAGVSIAQESRIFAGGSNSDDPLGVTTPEGTTLGATVAEDPETSALPGSSSELEDGRDASEPTVVTEATVEETRAPASNNVGKPGNRDRVIGKPERAGKPLNIGNPRHDVGLPAKGKPEERGNEVVHGHGRGQQKVTLCHKGKKTLTLGGPALAAHERHGDTRGACQTEGAGTEPSGQTMGPERKKTGGGDEGGSQDKVTLCHKNKTLMVGAGAQAAHLRHGDSLGACR